MGGSSDLAANLPNAVSPAVTNRVAAMLNNIYIPRLLTDPPPVTSANQPASSSQIFTFSQNFTGGYLGFSAPLVNQPTFSGSMSVSRTVVYPGSYIAIISSLTGVTQPGAFIWPSTGGGTFTVTSNSVTVSGQPGGTFTGTMQLVGTMAGFPTTTFTLSGPVTIDPSGTLTFATGGKLAATIGGTTPITIPGTVTGGTMIQGTTSVMGASQTANTARATLNGTKQTLLVTRQVPRPKL